MQHAGPPLEKMLRRLSECPPEFWAAPSTSDTHSSKDAATPVSTSNAEIDAYHVTAILADYFRRFEPDYQAYRLTKLVDALSSQQLGVLSILAWLLSDEWFTSRPAGSQQLQRLLVSQRIVQLGEMISAEKIIADPDRREELVRLALAELDCRPAHETVAQAKDRLATLDTGERRKILQATAAAERRAREVREAMARAKAMESASRYGE